MSRSGTCIRRMYRRDTSSTIRVGQRNVQIPRPRGVARVYGGSPGVPRESSRVLKSPRESEVIHPKVCPGARMVRLLSVRAVTLLAMPQQRQLVDYSLMRRATLAGLARGQTSAAEVCDAHPDLLRAARHHGEKSDIGCPICRKERLTRVTYAYGDELQHASGRARSSRSLDALAARFSQLRIYVVEVCQSCGWNHLAVSYSIGSAVSDQQSGQPPSPQRGRAGRPELPAVTAAPRDGRQSTARR